MRLRSVRVSPPPWLPRIWGCGDVPPLTRLGLVRLGYLGSVDCTAMVSFSALGLLLSFLPLTLFVLLSGVLHTLLAPRPWSTFPARGRQATEPNVAWSCTGRTVSPRVPSPLIQGRLRLEALVRVAISVYLSLIILTFHQVLFSCIINTSPLTPRHCRLLLKSFFPLSYHTT